MGFAPALVWSTVIAGLLHMARIKVRGGVKSKRLSELPLAHQMLTEREGEALGSSGAGIDKPGDCG
jgi:hypothetical protein